MRDAQIERLEDQRRLLVLSHERYVEEVTRDFDQRLDDDRRARLRQEEARAESQRELTETETQLEDDIDTEVENLRRMYKVMSEPFSRYPSPSCDFPIRLISRALVLHAGKIDVAPRDDVEVQGRERHHEEENRRHAGAVEPH